MINIYVFELLIPELFHLVLRLNFQPRNSTTALTPPNSKDKNE